MSSPTDLSPDDLLAQATCAVLIEDKIRGTAWLVSHEGHLLTAGHILGTNGPRTEVEVQFAEDVPRKAHKVSWGYQRAMGIDFAVLQLSTPLPDRHPLPVSLTRQVSGRFRAHGYGVTLRDRSVGVGEFLGPFDPQDSLSYRLFELDSKQLGEAGYSGAAVFSDELQAAVAIQIEATQPLGEAGHDTILAMPLYRVAQQWELLIPLVRQRENNHQIGMWQQERVEHLTRQLGVYYRNLNYTEEQLARTQPTPPLFLFNQRDQLNEAIAIAKSELELLGKRFDFAYMAITPPTQAELPSALWFYEDGKLVRLIDLEDLDWTKLAYLGRSRDCQIAVGQECVRVSRHHAQLLKTGQGYLLKDNRSRWGTYVNGEEIDYERGKLLVDGDQVVLGGLSIQGGSPATHTCVFVYRGM